MRILFVIKTLRYDGGVETSVASLANALISEGENVYIAAFCKPTENRLQHRLDLKEDNYLYLGRTGNILILPWQIFKTIIFLYRHKIDIIHTHLFHARIVGRFAAFFTQQRLLRLNIQLFLTGGNHIITRLMVF